MSTRQTAPGKLVLLGEYAVLHGFPAIVAAVDRRARVTLRPSRESRWSLSAPGIVDHTTFSFHDGRTVWGDPGAGLPLVERLLEAMARHRILPSSTVPFSAILDTTEFFRDRGEGRCKLGLGSSAALTVALAGALSRWAGTSLPSGTASLQLLVDLHREVQGGHGSGVDVAASLLGGVLAYGTDGGGRVQLLERVEIPPGVHPLCLFTGRAADTRPFLSALSARLADGSRTVASMIRELGATAEIALDAVRAGDSQTFLECIDAYCSALGALGDAMGVPVLTPEHAALRDIVSAHGGSYKPSGAGGGDVGVAFFSDSEATSRAETAALRAGFSTVPLAVTPLGSSGT